MPEITSLTRVWAPNPTATPTTLAPAINGPISTPSEDSAISPARTAISTKKMLRKIGRRVRRRAR